MILLVLYVVAAFAGIALGSVLAHVFFESLEKAGRARARTEDAPAEPEPEPEEDEPALFVAGEIVDVVITDITTVRGKLVGVVGEGDAIRFVVQVGHTTFLAEPDHCDGVEEPAVGYRESARSKEMN